MTLLTFSLLTVAVQESPRHSTLTKVRLCRCRFLVPSVLMSPRYFTFHCTHTKLYIQNIQPICRRVQKTLLGLSGLHCLHGVQEGFGVDKLFDLLDLQTPVVVGNDIYHIDRFIVHFDPESCVRLLVELWYGYHVEQVRCRSKRLEYGRGR